MARNLLRIRQNRLLLERLSPPVTVFEVVHRILFQVLEILSPDPVNLRYFSL